MSDKAKADGEAERPGSESEEHESWLREAAYAPHGTRIPRPGDLVGGKYRIESLIGRGGMGAVFRARHLVSERQVAIKWMLRPATDEQARRRFEREARAAGRIDHPNVVSLFDIGEDGDCSYLVMEFLSGESLRERLWQGPLQATEAVDLLLPAMRGVAAAHRAGVIHRDLKPDNIFLCRGQDGAPVAAKVLDFGISSITSLEAADSTLTQEGTLLGSLAYMSPEQLHHPHEVDARADVYSFGVILYELLSGKLPFRGPSHSALIVAIATTSPKRICELQPSVPPELDNITLRALARPREERFPDMAGLIEALLPFATATRVSGAPSRGSGTVQRAPVSVSPYAATERAQDGAGPTRSQDDGGEPPRGRRPARMAWAVVAVLLALTAFWVLGRERDARLPTADSAHPLAPAPAPVAAEAPSVAPAADPPGPSATTEVAKPPVIPAGVSAPAPAVRKPHRRDSSARRESAPDKAQPSTIEAREKSLFSGRK